MDDTVLVVDLGGTNMRAAVIGSDGEVLLRRAQPTPRQDPCPDALLSLVGDVLGTHSVAAVVVGVPGRIDHEEGALEYAPNLPSHWPGALREALVTDHLGVPVSLANDADLATVGEACFGAGRGAADVVYITVSTGVGAGVLLGGRLVRGRRSAAELGHTIVDTSAHARGEPATVEGRGSGTAFGRLGAAPRPRPRHRGANRRAGRRCRPGRCRRLGAGHDRCARTIARSTGGGMNTDTPTARNTDASADGRTHGALQPIALGRHLSLGTGSLPTLGWKRELTLIEVWNDRARLGDA